MLDRDIAAGQFGKRHNSGMIRPTLLVELRHRLRDEARPDIAVLSLRRRGGRMSAATSGNGTFRTW
jgi:hypothetical protein